jgi:hypothetical protein
LAARENTYVDIAVVRDPHLFASNFGGAAYAYDLRPSVIKVLFPDSLLLPDPISLADPEAQPDDPTGKNHATFA